MSGDSDAELFGRIVECEARQSGSIVEWVKEDPIRRVRLLLWMMDRFETTEGMDEIITAMVAAVKLKDMPAGQQVRELMRERLAIWDAAKGDERG